jgi:crotonobetaine/carnitine-CoA ligase
VNLAPQTKGGGPEPAHERTIPRLLERLVAQNGNRHFLTFNGQRFGYEDLNRAADRVAAGLQRLGVGKGDKVAVLMANRPEFLFAWFGIAKAGAVEVPINTAHRGGILAYMIDQADCRVAICESRFVDRLEPVLSELPKLSHVVVLDEPGATPPGLDRPTSSFADLVDNDGRYERPELLWSDPFAIIFTSGTTGPSKGPLLPHNYALYMGEVISGSVGYTPDDRLYNALPLFHGNAQLLSTMAALVSGAQMVLAERFSAGRFWSDVKAHGCTEFNYLGGVLPILMKAEPEPGDADNPLRVMFGAGCPPELFEPFERRFGVTLYEGYGMSEIGMPLMNSVEGRKVGTIGRPVYGCEVKLVDDDGLETPPGVAGEMLVRTGPPYTMLLEYYGMPDKTVEAWRDLWFHTGDFGRRDEDGYFSFVDRKKDALRRRGENISSWEVERVVNQHAAVVESAAIPVKTPDAEDEVMICVTLREGCEVSPEELLDHCQERMAYFMVPRYVRFMPALPKTATEKVQKVELRREGVTADTWDRESAGYQVRR